VSAAVWWACLLLAFAIGATFDAGWRWFRHGGPLRRVLHDPGTDERLGHRNLAWGPKARSVLPPRPGPGQYPKTGPPPSMNRQPSPPAPPGHGRVLAYGCGCRVKPCPSHELLADVERLASTPLGDTTP
jgi:hypothetical protein